MKKQLWILAILVVGIVALTGCSSANAAEIAPQPLNRENWTQPQPATPTPTPTPFPKITMAEVIPATEESKPATASAEIIEKTATATVVVTQNSETIVTAPTPTPPAVTLGTGELTAVQLAAVSSARVGESGANVRQGPGLTASRFPFPGSFCQAFFIGFVLLLMINLAKYRE